MDLPILRRAVHRRDVLHIRLDRRARASGIPVLRREVRSRHRVGDLPFPQVAELRIDCQQVVRGRRPGPPRPQDHQRPLDGMGCRLGTMVGVPLLDAQAVDQAVDDDGLDPLHRIGIVAGIGVDGTNEVRQAFLPSVRAEIGQAGAPASTVEKNVDCSIHELLGRYRRREIRAPGAGRHSRRRGRT